MVTKADGTLEELTDYYPYGKIKLDETSSSFKEKRKFTGHRFDQETDLSYMKARYYDGNVGRFYSQDPAFIVVGNSQELKNKTGLELEQYLSDPQQLNSYSYVKNNPLKYIDPTGEVIRGINRPVERSGTIIGAHSFIEITDNPNINSGQRTTLGGYTTNFVTGDLFKGENYHTDYNLSEDNYLGVHDIQVPIPYTQQGFERKVYESYQNLDDRLGAYSPFGGDFIRTGQGNSGNVFTQILYGAGLPINQINSYKTPGYYDAGVGKLLPVNKVQSLNTQISNIRSGIENLRMGVRGILKRQ